ncbi:MAG TPA: MBL fold metallo-hydrolase [Candidatus Kryptonia bacterium]|nr:MBL fold metallo-hydrolase [Candidatus Kryptonia bacterium]
MTSPPALWVRFWGVRGSYPAPGPTTAEVGGNSSCVEISTNEHTLIFDAGTGIIGLGRELVRRPGTPSAHIFLSHLHHDHIEGLRFFAPVYSPEWRCHIYGNGSGPKTLERLLARTMTPHLFPVALSQLPAKLSIRVLRERERLRFDGEHPIVVLARFSRAHPKVGVTMYRITYGGRSVVYATDIESPKGGLEDVVAFAHGADVLIHDAQYTDAEYHGGHLNKAGWGHSTVRMAAEAARAAKVKQLILYHHDPEHDDAEVHRLEQLARSIFPRSRAASEGLELRLRPR